MTSMHRFIFPGAIVGSLILASFGYSVMAHATKVLPPPAEQAAQTGFNTNLESEQNESNSENNTPGCALNNNFPADVLKWCTMIMRHASKNNLDPNLIAAVIWQESGGNPVAYSKSGAVGLMQVMPRDGIASTFQCINGPCFTSRPSIQELEKPNFNIKYGTNMLAGLLQKHGSLRDALKFYGPMNVGYYYADKVLNLYQTYGS